MKTLFLFLCFVATLASGEQVTFRASTVIPGGVVYAWQTEPLGPHMDGLTLPTGVTRFSPGVAYIYSWDQQYIGGFRVSGTAAPGTYNLTKNGTTNIAITVNAAPAARPVVQVDQKLIPHLQRIVDAGNDLNFAPDRYVISSAITLPDGVKLTSAGATLVRQGGGGGGTASKMFSPAGGFTLEGLTLDCTDDYTSPIYIHNNTMATGKEQTIRRCTIRHGSLQQLEDGSNLLVEDCVFDQMGMSGLSAKNSVWLRPQFLGLNRTDHAYLQWASQVLMVNPVFRGTQRGIVHQGSGHGSMYWEPFFQDVRGGSNNASECILSEENGNVIPSGTNGWHHNAVIRAHIANSAGPGISLFGSGHHHNWFQECDLHTDGQSIAIVASTGAIGANEFYNCELTGALVVTGSAGGQKFSTFGFLARPQGHSNQGPYEATWTAANAAYPIQTDATAIAAGGYIFEYVNYIAPDLSGSNVLTPITGLTFTP